MQLISKLQMPNYVCDVVIVDLAVLMGTPGSTVMDMVNCVHTVRRSVTKHPDMRLYVAVTADEDPSVIRQVVKTPGVHGLCPILTQGFDQHDLQLAVNCMYLYQTHIPDQIQQRLNQNKNTPVKQPSAAKLTGRQAEIFELVTVHAASNKVIAHRLKISEGSVKAHVTNLLRKFGLRSRTELAVYKHR
jgi:DNA-binding NarL/FixJ family response regulator